MRLRTPYGGAHILTRTDPLGRVAHSQHQHKSDSCFRTLNRNPWCAYQKRLQPLTRQHPAQVLRRSNEPELPNVTTPQRIRSGQRHQSHTELISKTTHHTRNLARRVGSRLRHRPPRKTPNLEHPGHLISRHHPQRRGTIRAFQAKPRRKHRGQRPNHQQHRRERQRRHPAELHRSLQRQAQGNETRNPPREYQ